MQIRVPDGWTGENDELRCGACMVKEMMQIRKYNEELKKEVRRMKSVDEERITAGIYEKNEYTVYPTEHLHPH